MENKIDLTNSSWDKETFLADIKNARNIIIDLLCAIPDNSDTGVFYGDIGDAFRFFNELEIETK